MTLEERAQKIKELQEQARDLIITCPHVPKFDIFEEDRLAICPGCAHYFGWLCRESPDGVCKYPGEVDSKGKVRLINDSIVNAPVDYKEVYYEECIYCHEPHERK